MSLSTCSSPLTAFGCTGELAGSSYGQEAASHCPPSLTVPPTCLPRYGAITFGNVLKSIPASFGARAPPMVRKIAVRRAAQVSCYPGASRHLVLPSVVPPARGPL
jgi:hypothetical protein